MHRTIEFKRFGPVIESPGLVLKILEFLFGRLRNVFLESTVINVPLDSGLGALLQPNEEAGLGRMFLSKSFPSAARPFVEMLRHELNQRTLFCPFLISAVNRFFYIKRPQMRTVWFLFLTLPAFMMSMPVHADEKDTFNLIAGASWQHDSNIFRLPSGVNASVLPGRADRWDNIGAFYAGVRLDKPYAMQRLKLDFTLTAFRYQNYDFLDFETKDYKAAWLWSLTPYLTGTLSADRKQQLNDFQDYQNYGVRNIRTTETQHFEADLSPHGNWHLLGGFTRSTQANSRTFNEEANFSMESLDAGIKYVFPSGSVITLLGHGRQGNYENRNLNPALLHDTAYDEREGEARLDWMITGNSRINLRAAYIVREHAHFSQRDFDGGVGKIEYNWAPTGKLRLALAASSELSTYQTDSSSYTRINTLTISPAYTISEKLRVSASASISERTFLGEGVIPSSERVDNSRLAGIRIEWMPLRGLSLTGNLQRTTRSSTSIGLDFTDTTAGVNANLVF